LLVEARERLAQLRECLRIKRSAEMAQPEDESGPAAPELRKEKRLAGSHHVFEFRSGIPNGRSALHWRFSLCLSSLYPNAEHAPCGSLT
jgi:hypothetical protein